MDPSVIAEHLAQAERHVEQGRKHVWRQRQLIEELELDSEDVTTARKLLAPFEEALALHLANQKRFLTELNAQRYAHDKSIERSRRWQTLGLDVKQAVRQSLAEILLKEYIPLEEISAELRALLKQVEECASHSASTMHS